MQRKHVEILRVACQQSVLGYKGYRVLCNVGNVDIMGHLGLKLEIGLLEAVDLKSGQPGS